MPQYASFNLTAQLMLMRTRRGMHGNAAPMLIWPDSSGVHYCARAMLRLPHSRNYQGMHVEMLMVFPSTLSTVVQGGMPGMHTLEQLAPDLAASANALPASGLLTAPGASQEHDSEQPSGVQAEVTSS